MLKNLIIFLFAGRMSRRRASILIFLSLLPAGFVMSAGGAENPTDPVSVRPGMNPELPTIFIAGDSTAAQGTGERQQGWAVPFADHFDSEKVNVDNRARGGRSSRTFITEGLWDALLADVKAGDLVVIQFGHNDGGAINEEPPGSLRPIRARGSLPGLGIESVEIDNVLTGKHETVYTFGHYMRRMIEDVRAREAQPVLVSLTLRNLRDNRGRLERGSGLYGGWIYRIALEADIPFIDLTNRTADVLEAMGKEEVDALFEQDYVHYNARGADLHARQIVAGLKGLRLTMVNDWLSEKGAEIEPDLLSYLRLPVPTDRRLPSIYLIGDSTVRNGRGDGGNGQWGWGDFLAAHVDLSKANVVNRAVGGLSSRTYLTYGHWDRVKAMLQPGDLVIMQFGHNDASDINDQYRARGTIKGFGEETVAIDNAITGKRETVHSYGWYLRKYMEDAQAAGAEPIVCSPVPRKMWDNRKIIRGTDSYGDWSEAVARSAGIAFVDLEELAASSYDQLGPGAVDLLFGDAHTHTNAAGALLNAGCFVQGLQTLKEHPLQDFLLNP